MLVIVAALGAAVAWGISAGFDNRSTRLIGTLQALVWVQLIGLAEVVPFAIWEGEPQRPSGHALAWIAVSVVGVIFGLCFSYAAIGRGAVSVVAPVTAVE